MGAEELQEAGNTVLDSFRETHTDEQQQFINDAFVETGEIPTE